MQCPDRPIDLDDPEARKRFDEEVRRSDERLKPLTDALDESERLTEKDFALVINV
jgi:hypothetical protein